VRHKIPKQQHQAKDVFEAESRVLYLESPAYVFGDTHGNLEDLHFFSDNLWRLGMNLCAGKFLFLGDYVDRGMSSLEVVTYLIALKTLYPDKVFMLRGNHETRDVNGWEEHYGDRSFIAQCKNRFGPVTGEEVWEELNCVFDRLPLAAVIDRDIFCIHGGVPRPLPNSPPGASRLEMLQKIPAVSGINPPYDHEDEHLRQMASECIWSDPAGEDQEESGELGDDGFGESPRGGGTICFGNKSLDDFLLQHGLSYVMRAHEAHSHGVSLSKKARCFTVFSTSKDHNQVKDLPICFD
jgi:diadenosine tetraphosphatase ApaH/serine/threonine PP2A family protein phosphatase